MKSLILFCIVFVASLNMMGQKQYSKEELKQLYIDAKKTYYNSKDKEELKKAFSDFNTCFAKGNDAAVYYIGSMYMNKKGVEKNEKKAFKYFKIGSSKGYSFCSLELGKIYQSGKSVKQNYEKAFKIYEQELHNKNSGYAYYLLGNLYFVGRGCEQDYTKAAELYKKGMNIRNANCAEMYTKCLRYGYGVHRDTIKANQMLKERADRNFSPCVKEYAQRPYAKIDIKIDKSDEIESKIGESYSELHNDVYKKDLTGNYTGYLITYDWSGKQIIQKNSIKLSIIDNKGKISGKWIENDTIETNINAAVKKKQIVFEDSHYKRFETDIKVYPLKYNFRIAYCRLEEIDNNQYLIGNIKYTISKSKSYTQPMSIVLKKQQALITKRSARLQTRG